MANKLQIMRGLKSKISNKLLSLAEPYFCTDTRELYIGTGSGNVNIGGSMWYKGTAMSGTSTTTGAYSYSACPQVKVGDTYLNTSNGNVYECTTAGSGTTAKWTYKGCIKGAPGSSITGQRGSKWYSGTAISGTSTTKGAYTWNDSEQKYIGDIYLNTSNGNIYECTTAGSGSNAKWTYVDSIFSNSKAVSIETSIKLIQKIENKSTAQMSSILGNIYSKISNPTVVEGDTYNISGAIPDGTIRYLVGSYEANDDGEFMYPVYIDNTATSKSYQIVNSAKEMYPLSTKHDALILFEGKYAFVLWATN